MYYQQKQQQLWKEKSKTSQPWKEYFVLTMPQKYPGNSQYRFLVNKNLRQNTSLPFFFKDSTSRLNGIFFCFSFLWRGDTKHWTTLGNYFSSHWHSITLETRLLVHSLSFFYFLSKEKQSVRVLFFSFSKVFHWNHCTAEERSFQLFLLKEESAADLSSSFFFSFFSFLFLQPSFSYPYFAISLLLPNLTVRVHSRLN